MSSAPAQPMNVPEGAKAATVAAGCFWGVEHMYRREFGKKGLYDARVGYISENRFLKFATLKFSLVFELFDEEKKPHVILHKGYKFWPQAIAEIGGNRQPIRNDLFLRPQSKSCNAVCQLDCCSCFLSDVELVQNKYITSLNTFNENKLIPIVYSISAVTSDLNKCCLGKRLVVARI